MTHQVEQYKEEIKSKDDELTQQDLQFKEVTDKNKKTKLEKKRVKKVILSTEEVIKN